MRRFATCARGAHVGRVDRAQAFPHRATNLLGIDQLGHGRQQTMLLDHVRGLERSAGE